MFELITGFYLLILVLTIFISKRKNTQVQLSEKRLNNGLTIIIPFKQEEKRLSPLIESFNKVKLPINYEVIFLDDHSTDHSVNLLLTQLDIKFTILRLRHQKGKKQALLQGVLKAKYENILSLDADVSFEPDYLINIQQLPQADLTILPVSMVGKKCFQKLGSIEFNWLQSLTFFTLNIQQPKLANGANLLFTKSSFINALANRSDANIQSGDDIFLLQALQKNNARISGVNTSSFAVTTPAPKNIAALISQRKRWIGKMFGLESVLTILILICYQLIFIYALIKLPNTYLWLIPLFIKLLIEWMGLNEKKPGLILVLLVHQFYYPIYGLLLCLTLPFPGKWKKIN